MRTSIGGYKYYSTEKEAASNSKQGEVTSYEAGLGWYNYNVKEYQNNPRKRIFGF